MSMGTGKYNIMIGMLSIPTFIFEFSEIFWPESSPHIHLLIQWLAGDTAYWFISMNSGKLRLFIIPYHVPVHILLLLEARKLAEKQLNDAKAMAQDKCSLQ